MEHKSTDSSEAFIPVHRLATSCQQFVEYTVKYDNDEKTVVRTLDKNDRSEKHSEKYEKSLDSESQNPASQNPAGQNPAGQNQDSGILVFQPGQETRHIPIQINQTSSQKSKVFLTLDTKNCIEHRDKCIVIINSNDNELGVFTPDGIKITTPVSRTSSKSTKLLPSESGQEFELRVLEGSDSESQSETVTGETSELYGSSYFDSKTGGSGSGSKSDSVRQRDKVSRNMSLQLPRKGGHVKVKKTRSNE